MARKLKTLLRELENLRGYDINQFNYKHFTKEEKTELEKHQNVCLQVEAAKVLIRKKYLKEFDRFLTVLQGVKELMKIQEAKKKKELQAKREEVDKVRTTAKAHFEALFSRNESEEKLYKELYDLTKPKFKRGFTKAELKKLKVIDDTEDKKYTATNHQLLMERIFNFAEDVSNEFQYRVEIKHTQIIYDDEKDCITATTFVEDTENDYYHMNKTHGDFIKNCITENQKIYFEMNLEAEHDKYNNFQEWYEANKEDEARMHDFYEYEDEALRNQESCTWIEFSLKPSENFIYLTAKYGVNMIFNAGNMEVADCRFKLADFEAIQVAETTNTGLFEYSNVVEKVARLILKCVEREKLFKNYK